MSAGRTFGNHGPQARTNVPAEGCRPIRAAGHGATVRRAPRVPPARCESCRPSPRRRGRRTRWRAAPGPRLRPARREGDTEVVVTNPRPAMLHLVRPQHFVRGGVRVPEPAGLREVAVGRFAQDQIARPEEDTRQQAVTALLVPCDPALDDPSRPAGPLRPVGLVAVGRAHPPGSRRRRSAASCRRRRRRPPSPARPCAAGEEPSTSRTCRRRRPPRRVTVGPLPRSPGRRSRSPAVARRRQ